MAISLLKVAFVLSIYFPLLRYILRSVYHRAISYSRASISSLFDPVHSKDMRC